LHTSVQMNWKGASPSAMSKIDLEVQKFSESPGPDRPATDSALGSGHTGRRSSSTSHDRPLPAHFTSIRKDFAQERGRSGSPCPAQRPPCSSTFSARLQACVCGREKARMRAGLLPQSAARVERTRQASLVTPASDVCVADSTLQRVRSTLSISTFSLGTRMCGIPMFIDTRYLRRRGAKF
jgi:hypothetical protein